MRRIEKEDVEIGMRRPHYSDSDFHRLSLPDGSVTVFYPRAESIHGGDFSISASSPEVGVCKSQGFMQTLGSEVDPKFSWRSAKIAILDLKGQISALEDDSSGSGGTYLFAICRQLDAETTPSTQFNSKQDGDSGTTVIDWPRYDYDNTHQLINADESDGLGVCRLFGFNQFVSAEKETRIEIPGRAYMLPKNRAPVIGRSGKLTELKFAKEVYSSITCK